MTVEDLERQFDYNYWATRRMLDVVSQLTAEEFTQPVAGSYESIRNTLVHVLSAEWGWLDRCGGPPRGDKLDPRNYPTPQSLVDVWTRVEEHMRGFLRGLTDPDLAREIEFAIGTGPKQTLAMSDMLQHAFVHSTHHRGQVSLLLRMLGKVPGNFDLLFYAAERRARG